MAATLAATPAWGQAPSAAPSPSAAEAAPTPERLFARGTTALRQGRYGEAIDQLEAFADRAPPHPDASFNRALAYLTRVKNDAERPGDLGRAAAALEEVRALRPDDAAASTLLEQIHAEVARRRARRGQEAVIARPTLGRIILRLASEQTWGIAAIIASLLLGLGLELRRREGSYHVAGLIMAPAAGIALLLFAPLYLGARDLRLTTRPGVLVAREAYFTDATGASRGGDPVPEAAKLEVGEREGHLVRARYGAEEGWLPAESVRLLRVP